MANASAMMMILMCMGIVGGWAAWVFVMEKEDPLGLIEHEEDRLTREGFASTSSPVDILNLTIVSFTDDMIFIDQTEIPDGLCLVGSTFKDDNGIDVSVIKKVARDDPIISWFYENGYINQSWVAYDVTDQPNVTVSSIYEFKNVYNIP